MGILSDEQVGAIRGPEEDARIKRLEKDKLRQRAVRATKRLVKEAELLETRQQWWDKNRVATPRHELEAMKAQHEEVCLVLDWMGYQTDGSYNDPNSPHYADPADSECYTSLEDGVKEIIEHVRQHGVAHLGYITSNADIPMCWSTRRFWADASLMQVLLDEGEPTANYVKYGLLTALVDWQVVVFLTECAKWSWDDAAKLVGYKVTNNVASYEKAS
jgi:hypothetical protein